MASDDEYYAEEGLTPNPWYQIQANRDYAANQGVNMEYKYDYHGGNWFPMERGMSPDEVAQYAQGAYAAPPDPETVAAMQRMEQENAIRQARIDSFNQAQSAINPDEAFQKVGDVYTHGGLPVRQDGNGNWFYDASLIAQNLGYTPEQSSTLIGDEWMNQDQLLTDPSQFRDDYQPAFANMANDETGRIQNSLDPAFHNPEEGAFLRNLARTPVFPGDGVDIDNQNQQGNIMKGYTTYDPGSGVFNAEGLSDRLYQKADEKKWYQPQRLIPMASLAAMAAMSAGAGSVIMAPAGAGIMGAGLGGAQALGLGAGTMGAAAAGGAVAGAAGALPSAYFQGMSGDVGGALKSVGTGALIGGVTGGLTQGASNLMGGGGEGVQSINFDSIPKDDPMSQQMIQMAKEMGTTPQKILDMAMDVDTLTQLQEVMRDGAATGQILDVFGRTAADYGYDSSVPFDQTSQLSDKDNMLWNLKTGGSGPLSELGYVTDVGAMAGVTPTNGALPDYAPGSKSFDYKDAFGKLMQLYQPDGAPMDNHTGFTNDMFTPSVDSYLPQSGGQAQGLGYQFSGMNTPDQFSQQYGAVRPVQQNYTQDLMSMAQENPDMLENPAIYNMLVEQIQGGGGLTKRLWEDPMTAGAEMVI